RTRSSSHSSTSSQSRPRINDTSSSCSRGRPIRRCGMRLASCPPAFIAVSTAPGSRSTRNGGRSRITKPCAGTRLLRLSCNRRSPSPGLSPACTRSSNRTRPQIPPDTGMATAPLSSRGATIRDSERGLVMPNGVSGFRQGSLSVPCDRWLACPLHQSTATMSDALPVTYLAGHGETAWTISRQHTGVTDLPLTARGQAEAVRLGERLAGLRFAAVFTSPLQRAVRTCELAGFGSAAQVDLDLFEWNYGAYEGRTSADIRALRPDWQLFR